MKKYTKEQILFAGGIGEVSMIDVRHVVSLLDEAVEIMNKPYDCRICKKARTNGFDDFVCDKEYLIPTEDCNGEFFEKRF